MAACGIGPFVQGLPRSAGQLKVPVMGEYRQELATNIGQVLKVKSRPHGGHLAEKPTPDLQGGERGARGGLDGEVVTRSLVSY